ncbi:MAG: glutamine-hydrolyzing GMP synthase [Chrysiogenetes bacterium]|nr:glutamine-hydrolyzing GMP synthase [Chrysiogenetes bacterium]
MHFVPDEKILILDFGSQVTQLIARRVRELEVYCEIHPYSMSIEAIREFAPNGIILSGSPASLGKEGAPLPTEEVYKVGVPVLGICYGLQVTTHLLGGQVEQADHREYGHAMLQIDDSAGLFEGLDSEVQVWMSHGDRISGLPNGFRRIAHTSNSPLAAIANEKNTVFGVQFHPEVVHTPCGKQILSNFVRGVCGLHAEWTMESFVERTVAEIREKVGPEGRAICGLSGGVDSSVAAVLVHKAIGDRLHCIYVDAGIMREGETEQVEKTFREHFHMNLTVVRAGEMFLERLAGESDPEKKRKIIGNTFIDVFDEEARKLGGADYLVQGTLYPDVIESVSVKGPSVTIKTHHNVGGLPEKMKLKLIEPLRELFKDEVRAVGAAMDMPREVLWRQPFPGPGLAIRVLGAVSPERLAVLRKADLIFDEEIRGAGLYDQLWQSFVVLLPVKTVGVMGDERTYEDVCALRAVTSEDAMTADWARLPYELLAKVSSRIINEVRGINRVTYDITSKPPGTIEWE